MRVEIDVPLSLNEICKATNSRPPDSCDGYINAICTDTREAQEGDLFIALTSENDSGENYVTDAKRKKCYVISSSRDKGILTVSDTAVALLELAKYYKSKLNIKTTVAVTGSVGKSTTVRFLKKILSQKHKVHSPTGNFNNHLGVPLTIFAAPKDTDVLITELGMNHRNEISALSQCVMPDIGIITAIGSAHLGNLGSRKEIAKAKLEILDGMHGGVLLVPKSEPLLSGVENAMYVDNSSSLSSFSIYDKRGILSCNFDYSFIKELNFFNDRESLCDDLSLALSVAWLMHFRKDEMINGARAINEGDLRQRFIHLKDYVIFDDSYNASLESIVADLKYIRAMEKPTGAFLGDILELGDAARDVHEEIGRRAAELGIGNLYLYGSYAQDVRNGAIKSGMNPDNVFINTDIASPRKSIEQIESAHKSGEVILFKASHKLRLDKIANLIKESEGAENERS